MNRLPTEPNALPFACCSHCECPPSDRIGHDDTCRLCRCSCGNRYEDDNLCMVSACQWEGIDIPPIEPAQTGATP